MEQRTQSVKKDTVVVATLVVNGETMKKIKGLQDVEYAVLITPTLHSRGNRIEGMAVTCHNERRPFSMPVAVFNEVHVEQHAI